MKNKNCWNCERELIPETKWKKLPESQRRDPNRKIAKSSGRGLCQSCYHVHRRQGFPDEKVVPRIKSSQADTPDRECVECQRKMWAGAVGELYLVRKRIYPLFHVAKGLCKDCYNRKRTPATAPVQRRDYMTTRDLSTVPDHLLDPEHLMVRQMLRGARKTRTYRQTNVLRIREETEDFDSKVKDR